jgi:ABC-type multidrug transport system fused ATPase/permease subunit
MLSFLLAKEKGLFDELGKYFYDKYFSGDLPYLENFKVSSNDVTFYKLIIIGLCVGLVVAAVCNVYNKRYIGKFIRHMIKEGCLGEKNAKTLSELGYLKNTGVRQVIKSGGSLSRWVRCIEEDEFISSIEIKRKEYEELNSGDEKAKKFIEPTFKRDLNTMHFYLPEDKKYAAEIRFDQKGSHPLGILVVIVVAALTCLLSCYYLPDLIKLFDNFISVMNK